MPRVEKNLLFFQSLNEDLQPPRFFHEKGALFIGEGIDGSLEGKSFLGERNLLDLHPFPCESTNEVSNPIGVF